MFLRVADQEKETQNWWQIVREKLMVNNAK